MYRCADCFISLHRAEGFGRCLAEAMLMQTPLICTAYSGNMSFTHVDNAWLVPYQLQTVQSGEYPHADGMQWAQADIAQAAACMRDVQQAPEQARLRAQRGAQDVQARHAPLVVGQHYLRVLTELWH